MTAGPGVFVNMFFLITIFWMAGVEGQAAVCGITERAPWDADSSPGVLKLFKSMTTLLGPKKPPLPLPAVSAILPMVLLA